MQHKSSLPKKKFRMVIFFIIRLFHNYSIDNLEKDLIAAQEDITLLKDREAKYLQKEEERNPPKGFFSFDYSLLSIYNFR